MKLHGLKKMPFPGEGLSVYILGETELPLRTVLAQGLGESMEYFNWNAGLMPLRSPGLDGKTPILMDVEDPGRLYDFLFAHYYRDEAAARRDLDRIKAAWKQALPAQARPDCTLRREFTGLIGSIIKSQPEALGRITALPLVASSADGSLYKEGGWSFYRMAQSRPAFKNFLVSGAKLMLWMQEGAIQALRTDHRGLFRLYRLTAEEEEEFDSQFSYIDLFPPDSGEALPVWGLGYNIYRPFARMENRTSEGDDGPRMCSPSQEKFLERLNVCLVVPASRATLVISGRSELEPLPALWNLGRRAAERIVARTRGRVYSSLAIENAPDAGSLLNSGEFGEFAWLACLHHPLTGRPLFKVFNGDGYGPVGQG